MSTVNTFVPLSVTGLPTSFTDSPNSEAAYALERLSSSLSGTANPAFAIASSRSNFADAPGEIFRGYIRRSDLDSADPTSGFRLYFMYNPETIRRSYVAYLDQQALDPGNALFGSNNLAAAPGIVDFSFDLLFDRHIEVSQDPQNPGTKIDYDYFDLVVRGVVPNSNTAGNDIPDNGIMMVNPSNLTVVFGQELAVKGRAYNARVRLEKFNHRMVPTRMRISLLMKVFYMGPVQTLPNFTVASTQAASLATVPYDNTVTYSVTSASLTVNGGTTFVPTTTPTSGFTTPYTGTTPGGNAGPISPGVTPAGIPKGPFPVRLTRNKDTYLSSNVAPVTLTPDQVLQLLLTQDLPVRGAVELWAIVGPESNFVANAAGINWDDSIDVGLWQINSVNFGPGLTAEFYTDPWENLLAAVWLWKRGGLRHWYATPDIPAAEQFFRDRGILPPVGVF